LVKISGQWKELEKTAARKLGGVRLVRGDDFGESMLDVEHEWLACDAKWRTKLSVMTLFRKLEKDNDKIYGKGTKIPILIMKEKGMRGELIVIKLDDFIKVVNGEGYKIEPK
jgi:hypothetical protein